KIAPISKESRERALKHLDIFVGSSFSNPNVANIKPLIENNITKLRTPLRAIEINNISSNNNNNDNDNNNNNDTLKLDDTFTNAKKLKKNHHSNFDSNNYKMPSIRANQSNVKLRTPFKPPHLSQNFKNSTPQPNKDNDNDTKSPLLPSQAATSLPTNNRLF